MFVVWSRREKIQGKRQNKESKKKKRKRKKALISWLGFLVSKLRGCDYLGIEQGQAAERGERASWGKKESEFVCVLVFVYVPVIRSTCSHSEGQPAVRMSIRVCICVFSQFECINSCACTRPLSVRSVCETQCISSWIRKEMAVSGH